MNDNFERAWDEIQQWEGGFVNDPDDAGGETFCGISKRQYPELDIRHLTLAEAKNIYYLDYWLKYRLHEVEHCEPAVKLMSLLINMPPRSWGRIAQRALRAVGVQVKEDGIVGSKTIHAINAADPDLYLVALRSEAAGYYRSLNNKRFENGWLNRAYA